MEEELVHEKILCKLARCFHDWLQTTIWGTCCVLENRVAGGKTDKGGADEEDSLLEDKDDGPEDLLNERDEVLEFSEEVIVAPSSVEQGRVVEERFFLKKVEHMLQQDKGGCRQMFVVHDLFEMISQVMHCYKDDSWDEQIGFVASSTPKWFSIIAAKRGVKSEKLRSQQENLKQVLYESFHSSFQDLSSST